MIDAVIAWSIRQRGVVILVGIVLALAGWNAAMRTPIDAVPDLSENQVIVFTEWQGQGPREIEDQITSVISRRLRSVLGVRTVRGSSDVGFSMIHVVFDDSIGLGEGRSRITERLSSFAGELPRGVLPRVAPDAIPTGQIFWYTLEGPGYDLATMRDLQDWFVRPQLEAVDGVAEVASVGGLVQEFIIALDAHRLREFDVDPETVQREIAASNIAAGGGVVHTGNAEFVVRTAGWLGESKSDVGSRREAILSDLRRVIVPSRTGQSQRLESLGTIRLGARPRRGVLEKDGNEVVGGVVLARHLANPLDVTRRLKEKVAELTPALPPRIRIVPCYDRTPLIEGAVGTVTGTLVEAIVTAVVCVVLVLLHLRASFVIAITLPLAALLSFAGLWLLRWFGIADIQTNIMSLAGISISIGVLVDSSIVMAENAMHHLRERFGDVPVKGDIREFILPACQLVGRPIFGSVVVMLLSFLPVLTLGGIDGRMYRPLAVTKCLALLSVAVLAVTLVPALCTFLLKGKMRRETESWIVRGVVDVYRPVLTYLLNHPLPLVWSLGVLLILAACATGESRVVGLAVTAAVMGAFWMSQRIVPRAIAVTSLILAGLVGPIWMTPLAVEMRMPLDEGMLMDMPITVPRVSSVQAADDLKTRDMALCRFPEIDMVVGKAGRADTSFDPAPLDMIESMIMFHPREFWPKRKLNREQVLPLGKQLLEQFESDELVEPIDASNSLARINEAVGSALDRFDAQQREYCYHRRGEFRTELQLVSRRRALEEAAVVLNFAAAASDAGRVALAVRTAPETLPPDPWSGLALEDARALLGHAAVQFSSGDQAEKDSIVSHRKSTWDDATNAVGGWFGMRQRELAERLQHAVRIAIRDAWSNHVRELDAELARRIPDVITRLVAEELLDRSQLLDVKLAARIERIDRIRRSLERPEGTAEVGHHGKRTSNMPFIDPHPKFDRAIEEISRQFASTLSPRQASKDEMRGGHDGELNRTLSMPGWTNVWTMPIQNRVDMLATGITSEIGVRVLGRDLDAVVDISEEIANVLREVPGAVNVVADPVRGKGHLRITPLRESAAARGVAPSHLATAIELATGGRIVSETLEGGTRHAVRLTIQLTDSSDLEALSRLEVPAHGSKEIKQVPLGEVASIELIEGPATIKSENGLPRNYVRLNVVGRDSIAFVEEARRIVASRVQVPEGTIIEWTGQYEHAIATRRQLWLLFPAVVGLIFGVLWLTYRDLTDALSVLIAVPGALAGGVFFQWLFGFPWSMAVGVGYIACFGMAAATGMIMLVYLREAVDLAGGIEHMTVDSLRDAVLAGAVQRLRPKLLTEATTLFGLAPMLWATGPGAEVIRPMAAPVLGGILVADEVIDLLLPIVFFLVRKKRLQSALAERTTSEIVPTAQSSSGSATSLSQSSRMEDPQ